MSTSCVKSTVQFLLSFAHSNLFVTCGFATSALSPNACHLAHPFAIRHAYTSAFCCLECRGCAPLASAPPPALPRLHRWVAHCRCWSSLARPGSESCRTKTAALRPFCSTSWCHSLPTELHEATGTDKSIAGSRAKSQFRSSEGSFTEVLAGLVDNVPRV